jgi:hypothetical protein
MRSNLLIPRVIQIERELPYTDGRTRAGLIITDGCRFSEPRGNKSKTFYGCEWWSATLCQIQTPTLACDVVKDDTGPYTHQRDKFVWEDNCERLSSQKAVKSRFTRLSHPSPSYTRTTTSSPQRTRSRRSRYCRSASACPCRLVQVLLLPRP